MKKLLATAAIIIALTSPVRADVESAADLFAVIAFVEMKCPDLRINKAGARAVMHDTGYSMEAGLPSDVISLSAKILVQLEDGPEAPTCERIWRQFGAEGAAFPDVVLRR